MTGSEYQKNSITLSGAVVAMGAGVMIGAGHLRADRPGSPNSPGLSSLSRSWSAPS